MTVIRKASLALLALSASLVAGEAYGVPLGWLKRPSSATYAISLPSLAAPFTSSGAQFTEPPGTTEHLIWNGSALVSLKGNTAHWVQVGTVPQGYSTQAFPSGFAYSGKGQAGPFSAANHYKYDNNSDPFDPTGNTIWVCVRFTPADTSFGRLVSANVSNTIGYTVYTTAGSTGFTAWGTGFAAAGSYGTLAGSENIFCGGANGTQAFGQTNFFEPSSSASYKTGAALTAAAGSATRIGVEYNDTNEPFNGTISEIIVGRDDPAYGIAFATSALGASGVPPGSQFISANTTAASYTVNGTSFQSIFYKPRINENGLLISPTKDMLRVPNSTNGARSGSGSLTVRPDWAAASPGSDRWILGDAALAGLSAGQLSIKYLLASSTFRLTVGAITVDSAAQSFAANTTHTLAWRYTVGQSACLTVDGIVSCSVGVVASVTPGAFLSFGADPGRSLSVGATGSYGYGGAISNISLGPTDGTGAIPTPVVCIGDSNMLGWAVSGVTTYIPMVVQAALGSGYYVDNWATSGDQVVGGITSKWANHVSGRGYRYVVVMGGTNDILLSNRSAAAIEPFLSAIYANAIAQGATVISLTIPPNNNMTAGQLTERTALNAWIMAQCPRAGLKCLDTGALFDNGSGGFSTTACGGTCTAVDGTHLSQAAMTMLGNAVAAAIP